MAKEDVVKCNGVELALDRSVKTIELKDKDKKVIGEKKVSTIKVSQKDLNKLNDSYGYTKEVRDIVDTAKDGVVGLMSDLSGEETLKTGNDTVVKVGTGNGSWVGGRKCKKEFRNPATGATEIKYGSFDAKLQVKVPKHIKQDEAGWQTKIEKSFA